MVHAPSTAHNNNFDPLRGLAAAAVFIHHLSVYTGLAVPWLATTGGLLGVQLFFIISGYLIVQSASTHSLRVYLTRRVFRIFPAYWVAVLAVAAAYTPRAQWHLPPDITTYALHFFALTHFSPSALQRHDVLTVSWTLTIECCWYALVPLLVWGARMSAARHYWLAVGVGALVLSSTWVGVAQIGWLDALYAAAIRHAGVDPVTPFMRFAYIVNAAPAQWVFFMMGALLWRYETALRQIPQWFVLLVLTIGTGAALHWNHWLGLNPSFASGVGLSALLLLARQLPAIPWRWPHYLGQLAYPVYLLHVPVMLAVFNTMQIKGLPGLVLFLAALLLAATPMHHLIEAPMNRLGRTITT